MSNPPVRDVIVSGEGATRADFHRAGAALGLTPAECDEQLEHRVMDDQLTGTTPTFILDGPPRTTGVDLDWLHACRCIPFVQSGRANFRFNGLALAVRYGLHGPTNALTRAMVCHNYAQAPA